MILIIDLSYFVFHRYYATKSYVKISEQSDSISISFDDLTFTDMFKTGFRKDLKKIVNKFGASEIYFAKDCARSEIWRNSIYSEYKSRKQLSDFDGRAFEVVYDELIPELKEVYKTYRYRRSIKNIPLYTISHATCEADDICAVLCKKIFGSTKKTIITGDHDYLQLVDDTTAIYDMKFRALKSKSIGCAREDLLLKILTGDKSDNIPSICSKKHALSLIRDGLSCEEIANMYRDDARFQLNRNLVDMDMIPEDLVISIVERLKNI